jgi:hypothetical protein
MQQLDNANGRDVFSAWFALRCYKEETKSLAGAVVIFKVCRLAMAP